jgi:ferredoxin-type protein NapH
VRLGPLRRVSQGAGLLLGLFGFTGIGMTHLIFPGLHCYACPWAITICPIGLLQNLVIYGTFPYFWLGTVAAYGLIAGRGFCGWFCPFGTLNDLVSLRRRPIQKSLSYGKFAVLLATILLAWGFADTLFCKVCPAASLEASIPYVFLGVATVNRPFLIHLGTFAGTLVGMILVARFWCRYLCPMGAVFALFNGVSLVHLELDPAHCTGCALCTPACPMGLEPHRDHDDHNCTKCGACVQACSRKALALRFAPRKSRSPKR